MFSRLLCGNSEFLNPNSYFVPSLSAILDLVLGHITDLVAWLEPHALLLALVMPPVIRVVGHWIPEELFMIAIGVLAARARSSSAAAGILGAVVISHFTTDQMVYLAGRWLRPRLERFPRIEGRLRFVTDRLTASPVALLGLVPARILPVGRGAWLAACGVVRVAWSRFAAVDFAALVVHVAVWSGLGWWFAGDLNKLSASADTGRLVGTWLAVALVIALSAVVVWRSRESRQASILEVVNRPDLQPGRSDRIHRNR